MEQRIIHAQIIDGYCVIDAGPNIRGLKAENQSTHESAEFEQAAGSAFRIAVPVLESLLLLGAPERLHIVDTDGAEIDLAGAVIEAGSALDTGGAQPIYLYPGLDKKLRFLRNQVPSYRAYGIDAEAVDLAAIDGNLRITADLRVQYLPPATVQVNFINRTTGQKYHRRVSVDPAAVTADSDGFSTRVSVLLDPAELPESDERRAYMNSYHDGIFDVSVSVTLRHLPVTAHTIRLGAEHVLPQDFYFDQDGVGRALMAYRAEPHQKLSLCLSKVSSDAIHAYQTQLDQPAGPGGGPPIVLFGEYSKKAQDNAFVLFQYFYEHAERLGVDPYFVVSADSRDADQLAPYLDRVVWHGSREHVEKFLAARVLGHSHLPRYLLPLVTHSSWDVLNQKPKVYLRHGLLAVRNAQSLYGKATHPYFTSRFIVSSEREKQIAVQELEYSPDAVAVTGLARFDPLLQGNSWWASWRRRHKVLVMPSWREGHDRLSETEFLASEFYQSWETLLGSQTFIKLRKRKKLSVKLYLHTNFQRFSHLFEVPGVQVVAEGTASVQGLLKDHGVLITDFSSVGFDFSLLRRTVLYYQPGELPTALRDVNHREILPGPVHDDPVQLLGALARAVRWNILPRQYRRTLRTNIYSFNDRNARERNARVILDLLQEADAPGVTGN